MTNQFFGDLSYLVLDRGWYTIVDCEEEGLRRPNTNILCKMRAISSISFQSQEFIQYSTFLLRILKEEHFRLSSHWFMCYHKKM